MCRVEAGSTKSGLGDLTDSRSDLIMIIQPGLYSTSSENINRFLDGGLRMNWFEAVLWLSGGLAKITSVSLGPAGSG